MGDRRTRATAAYTLAIAIACATLVAGCAAKATPVGAPVSATESARTTQPTPETAPAPAPEPAPEPAPAPQPPDGGGGGGGGGGGSGGGGGNQAAGSPIDVPTIPAKHQLMDDVRDGITGLFVEACGGEVLCVNLEFGDGACFVGYDPAGKAERGSTVSVLTESQEDCDAANGFGSPIDVPTIPDKHQPMEDVRDGITGLFVEACGGEELCVNLEFGDGACFVGYDPAGKAERGSTVSVLTESQEDCDAANGLGPDSETDGSSDTGVPDGSASG